MKNMAVGLTFMLSSLMVCILVWGGDLDINNDGVDDLRLNIENGYLIEYGDFNFDGKYDRKTKYNKNDVIISVEYDQNYNGFMETFDYLVDGLVIRSEIDIDENGVVDTVFLFGRAEKKCLAKISESRDFIEKTIFNFNYPGKTTLIPVDSDNGLKQLIAACKDFE